MKIRIAKENVEQEVHYITCDNCGKEERHTREPYLEDDEPFYCMKCWSTASKNDAFKRNKHLIGAKVIGFRFDGNHGRKLISVVLKKGKKEFEIRSRNDDDWNGDYDQENELDVLEQLKLVRSCYMFKYKNAE